MFHRLTAPSYIGGLPVGYDYLNNLLSGTPALVDPVKPDGVNAGTYFVAFGEDGRSAAANRGLAALAANTDAIDDLLRANVAVTASIDISPVGPAVVTGTASVPVFCGPPGTANTAAGLEPYFHITDLNNNDIVDAGTNTQVKVTAVSPGGAVGTFYVGAVTLTLSPAPSVPYRIWYGSRSSLAEMTKGELVRPSIWSVQRKQAGFIQFTNDLVDSANSVTKGGSLVGIYDGGFNAATTPGGGLGGLGINTVQKAVQKINDRFYGGAGKVDIVTSSFVDTAALTPVRGGGIGASFSPVTVQAAMEVVDKQLVRRRAYTAVATDGTYSIGGDYNGTNIDGLLSDFSVSGGRYFVRPGIYEIANGTPTTYGAVFSVDTERGVVLQLAAARSSDLLLTNLFELSTAVIASFSTTYRRFQIGPTTDAGGARLRSCSIQAGAVLVSGGTTGFLELNRCDVLAGPALGGTSTNAGLEITGDIRTHINNCTFTGANGSPARNFYLHGQADIAKSQNLIENSYFLASDANVSALDLASVSVPTIFRNCTFEVTATSGTGYAASIDACSQIRFDNCIFKSANGQVLKSLNSSVDYVDCQWISTDGTPAAATGQMVVIQPSSAGASSVTNCRCTIGASSLRGSAGAGTKAVIELGGLDGTATSSNCMDVDGLYVTYGAGVTAAHNATTIVLHGNADDGYVNRYRRVVFNTNGVDATGAGTLHYTYTLDYPGYIEIGGGISRGTCIVEDIQLLNVKNPSSSHNRYGIFAQLATIRGLVIDGTSTAGNSFGRNILHLNRCTAENVRVEVLQAINCTDSHVELVQSTWCGGGALRGASAVAPTYWLEMSTHSHVRDVMLLWTSSAATSVPGVRLGSHCSVADSTLWVDGTWATEILNTPAGATGARVHGNIFYWERQAIADQLNVDGYGAVVLGNQFRQAGASSFLPTWSVAGGNTVDSGNTNTAATPAVSPPFDF